LNLPFRYLIVRLVLPAFFIYSCGSRTAEKSGTEPVTHTESTVEKPLRKIRIIPYWTTTAQFSGYFVGIEKGIYQKYGLDPEIISYDPEMDLEKQIHHEIPSFAILWMVNAIEAKANGLPIVNIAQFSVRSSLMLITKKSSGIHTVEAMNGHRAGIWAGYEMQPKTLFKKYHIDVEITPIGNTNNLFLADGVQITNANWFDEYHAILNSGFDPDDLETFFFADYGLNFLEDGIYCLKETADHEPALCSDFINATIESWYYAFNHEEEAVEIVLDLLRKQKIMANKAHQHWMIDRYRDLYLKADSSINTRLPYEAYQSVARILLEAGLIGEIPAYHNFYQPYQRHTGGKP
jgi:NitT/TauT family transport system substrate-binding protein